MATPKPTNEFGAVDWQHLPGATIQGGEVHIAATDYKIVEQDGSGGQSNPPINLYGASLATGDSFTITAPLEHVAGNASLELYGAPPIIADEFRIEAPSLRLTVEGNHIEIKVWNGHDHDNVLQQRPYYDHTFTISSATDTVILELSKQGNTVTLGADGNALVRLKDVPALETGHVWLGADSTRAGFILGTVAVAGHATIERTPQTLKAPLSPSGLQALVNKVRPGFTVGAAMALGPLAGDAVYRNEALSNFGALTPENAMKWQFIEPQPGQYDFQEADALVAIAQKQGMIVHGHTLVFSEANPAWVQALPTKTVADKQAAEQVMRDHITQTVGHFKGKIKTWDVVNEPLADDISNGLYRNNKWYAAMGPDYIATAFASAHAADPAAKLYINEYGLEANSERWDAFYSLIKQLKSAGVPIDGVGFESHVYERGDQIDASVLKQHIDELAGIGVVSRISEMDVYNDDGVAVQAQQYDSVFAMCLQDPHCMSFATWGVDDNYDYFQNPDHTLGMGNDFLFTNGQPTAAYKKLQAYLQGQH